MTNVLLISSQSSLTFREVAKNHISYCVLQGSHHYRWKMPTFRDIDTPPQPHITPPPSVCCYGAENDADRTQSAEDVRLGE